MWRLVTLRCPETGTDSIRPTCPMMHQPELARSQRKVLYDDHSPSEICSPELETLTEPKEPRNDQSVPRPRQAVRGERAVMQCRHSDGGATELVEAQAVVRVLIVSPVVILRSISMTAAQHAGE